MTTTEAAQSPVAEPRTLRQRVLRAGSWSLAAFVAAQGIRFATNLVMTRLLAPEMFGVMAIAQMVMMGLALFSDLGLKLNVIQSRRGSDPLFLNTVWVTQILIGSIIALGAALAGAAFAAANSFGVFAPDSAYAAPVLPYVLAALGLGMVVSSFESTKVPEASRGLALGRIVVIQLFCQVASVAAMLALSTVDRSVWVLVIGGMVGTALGTLLSHVWLPGTRNRFQWDRVAFREIYGFGKWIFLSSAVGFLALTADKILLGGLVSASTLGVYSIAVMLVFAVEQVLSKLVSDVAFPALSEVARERRADLRSTVYKFYVPLAALSYATAAALAVSGSAIVRMLYDDRYHDAGWMLQILAAILLSVPSHIHAQCFLALGNSRWQSNLSIIRLATVVVVLPSAYYLFGLAGAVWGAVLSYLCVMPAIYYYASKCDVFDPRKEIVSLGGAIPGALLGAFVVFVLSR